MSKSMSRFERQVDLLPDAANVVEAALSKLKMAKDSGLLG